MKKLLLLVFFLVTWTVERHYGDFDWKEDAYGRRAAKTAERFVSNSISGNVRTKSFETVEAARKFMADAPKERSGYGDRIVEMKLQRVEEIPPEKISFDMKIIYPPQAKEPK